MAAIDKDTASNYLNLTRKSIAEKEKQPASPERDARLKKLRSFESALRDYLGPDHIETPMGNLKFVKPWPDSTDVYKFSFPGWPPKEEEQVEIPKPEEKKPEEKKPEPTVEQQKPTPVTPPQPKESQPAPEPIKNYQGKPIGPQTRTKARIGQPNVQQTEVPLSQLQNYRRQLQGEVWRAIDAQNKAKTDEESKKTRAHREDVERTLNRVIAYERQQYDAGNAPKPSDWSVDHPRDMSKEEGYKQPRININNLPDILKESTPNLETYGREPGPKAAPEHKGKGFLNVEVRKILNDIAKARNDIEKLDPRVAANQPKIRSLEEQIDKTKEKLRFYRDELLPIGIENKSLTDEYKNISKELNSLLTPEQKKAYDAGKEINIRQIPNQRRFFELLRELGRERDRIYQGLDDEMMYVNSPNNLGLAEYRKMDPEERQFELNRIKKDNFMRQVREGVEDYYKRVDPSAAAKDAFNTLAPEKQQKWAQEYAAELTRKGGANITSADTYKWFFGGGKEFISKYPPELYEPMIKSARQGLRGIGETNQLLKQQLMGALPKETTPEQIMYGPTLTPSRIQELLGSQSFQQVPPFEGPYGAPQQQPMAQQQALPNLREMLTKEL